MNIEEIERIINYEFKNKDLLERALTRKAYAKEKGDIFQECKDQEVFRTLGDAVLKAIIVDLLIKSNYKTGGKITEKKIKIEKKRTLAEIAENLGIGTRIKIRTNKGEIKQQASKQPYVLAETFEALIAAVYYDRGYNKAKETVEIWLKDNLPQELKDIIKF